MKDECRAAYGKIKESPSDLLTKKLGAGELRRRLCRMTIAICLMAERISTWRVNLSDETRFLELFPGGVRICGYLFAAREMNMRFMTSH